MPPARTNLPLALPPILLVAAALAAGLLGAAPAAAGQYVVHQCGVANLAHDDARFRRVNPGDYAFGRHCGEHAYGNSLQVRNISSAPRGNHGEIAWISPEGTRIHSVRVTANLRSDAGHRARLVMLGDAGGEVGRIATGPDAPGGFSVHSDSPASGRRGFAAVLRCEIAPACPHSEQARAWLRDLQLTLRDSAAPRLSAAGPLLEAGWRRGPAALAVNASDRGSGLASVTVTVNGAAVAPGQTLPCASLPGARARRMQPCPAAHGGSAVLETGRAPFADGANRLRACAADYGSGRNQTCLERTVMVDNRPPALAFLPRDPDDPELIRARISDAHSGPAAGRIEFRREGSGAWQTLPTILAGGELRARVDSSAHPAGHYRFRAVGSDRAGNLAIGERDLRGEPLVLRFPLRERSLLGGGLRGTRGGTIAYGAAARWAGALRDAGGRPLAGRQVTVVERFAAGSDRAARERTVRTDRRGRYAARLAPGPTRRVFARFGGSRRYLPASTRARRLAVRGRAVLRVSRRRVRAGGRVGFRATVGTAGVALPARGKLVELQAREQGRGRYRTVRQALRTDGSGRLRTGYTFERFYRRPVAYQFRLKVPAEGGWPYAGPALSRARKLLVRPRR
jgi:hypothetical protein